MRSKALPYSGSMKDRLDMAFLMAGFMMMTGITCITRVFAQTGSTPEGGGGGGGDNIFDAVNNGSGTIIDTAVTTCNKSILPIAVAITLITMLFCGSNERLAGALKTALKIEVVAGIALNCINLVINTIIWVAEKFGGSTTITAAVESVVRMI